MSNTFGLEPGDIIAEKYEIVNYLGGGWEGEVFRIREKDTQIERAAKLFLPKRNIKDKTSTNYAKKLHKLRSCPVLIKYHNIEKIEINDQEVTMLISEYVEGLLLTDFRKKYRGSTLPIYQGLHLLYSLTQGVESIHKQKEYHGDLHAGNVIVQRLGHQFEIKLLDLFNLGRSNKENLQYDILGVIKIFHEAIGGQKKYSKHPPIIKQICCGLKQTLILKKFRTISHLKLHLETIDWV